MNTIGYSVLYIYNTKISILKEEFDHLSLSSKTDIGYRCKLVISLLKTDDIIIEHKKIVMNHCIYSLLKNHKYLHNILVNIGNYKNIVTIFNTFISVFEKGYLHIGCVEPTIFYPCKIAYDYDFITNKRKKIYDKCLINYGSSMFDTFSEDNLYFISNLYFYYFFPTKTNNIEYKISNKCKTSCGKTKTVYSLNLIRTTIKIAFKIIYENIKKEGCFEINGIIANDRLSALQLVLEHELCHYIVDSTKFRINQKDKKEFSEHGKFFRQISHNYFNHKGSSHKLFIPNIKANHLIGDIIKFEIDNEIIQGVIIKLNKSKYKVSCVMKNDETCIFSVPYELVII